MLDLKNKDMDTALWLKDYIEQIDRLIFPENPTRVVVHEDASRRNFRAMYTHPRPGGGDYYSVFTKGLYQSLSREWQDGLLMVVGENGCVEIIQQNRIVPAQRQVLIAIACHEVRHRMQLLRRIKFLAQDIPEGHRSELCRHSLHYVELLFKEVKKGIKYSNRIKQHRIRSMTNRYEIDATTIETMVLHSIQVGTSLTRVVPLLSLGRY